MVTARNDYLKLNNKRLQRDLHFLFASCLEGESIAHEKISRKPAPQTADYPFYRPKSQPAEWEETRSVLSELYH